MIDPPLGQPTDERALPARLVPSSSAAAGSFRLRSLPDLPHFAGPASRLLGDARFAVPLLVLGSYYTLAIHGVLSVPALVIASGVGLAGVLTAHATLLGRRKRLLRVARAMREYAELTVGEQHELYRRATKAITQLEQDPSVTDLTLATDVEQGIGYTRELLLCLKDGETQPRGLPPREGV